VVTETRVRRNFRDWYDENAESLSEKRKKNYKSDPEMREAAKARAKDYRDRRKQGERVQRVLQREYKGVLADVFSTGYIASELGASTTMLIKWEKKGWLPEPVFNEHHRLYTGKQKSLITELYVVVQGKRAADISTMIEKVHDDWT
jgi:hypothetical protein